MKRNLLVAVMMAFAFAGCQTKVQNLEVKKDEMSRQTKEWNVSVSRSVFSSTNPEVNKSCEILNGEIQKTVNGLVDSLKAEAAEFFQAYATDTTGRPLWSYELIVTDSVFMANEHYVSVRLLTYTFTGGAHGMTNFYAFNYDVRNKKMLTNKEVINYAKTQDVNALLKKNFRNPEKCFNTDPSLDLVSTINFNRKNVCFTYAQYTLGAYACGYAQVNVPRNELKTDLLIKED